MHNIVPERFFFTWDIQYQCNYNCTYCFLHFEKKVAGTDAVFLKPYEWFEIWDDIYKRYGQCHIQVTGGEPFVYPDFINLISELSRIHTFSVSTNLSWDIDEFKSKISPKRIKVDASFHPEFVSIDEFLNKILKLKKNDYLTSVTMVAYPPLLEKIKDFGKTFKDSGIKLILYPYRGPFQDRTFPKEYADGERALLRELGLQLGENVSKCLEEKQLSKKNISNADKVFSGSSNLPEKGLKDIQSVPVENKKMCHMGQRYAKIIPNGDVYRCCAAVWDETKPWDNWGGLGNLVKKTFKLLDKPAACSFWENCLCHKSMVIGEEKRWLKEWSDIYQMRKVLEIKRKLEQAKILRDEGRFNETIDTLQKVITEEPKDMQALTLLAECYTIQGDFAEAERIIKFGLENNFDPDNLSWMYRVLAKVYNRLAFSVDDPEQRKLKCSCALEYLSKAIKAAVDSNNVIDQSEGYYEIAEIFYLSKDFDKAIEHIQRALKYNPNREFLHRKKNEWSAEREKFSKNIA